MTRKEQRAFTPAKASEAAPEDRIDITYIRVEDLIPYENNPRNNDETVQTLVNSMRDFGTKVPPVVTRDGVIVTGHTRLKAAIAMGKTVLPCIVAEDLDDAKAKMFRLADNKIQESSTWDFDRLVPELEEVKALGFEVEDFNFTPLDLDPFCFDEEDEDTGAVMLSEEEVSATIAGDAPKAGIMVGDRIDLGGIVLVCGSVSLDDLIAADADGCTHELHEPDPTMCEALARGWMEETGRTPTVTRNGERAEVLRGWKSIYTDVHITKHKP